MSQTLLSIFWMCASFLHAAADMKTVSHVDLNQYLGLWNELYRIPNSFQDNHSDSKSACFNTTAEYRVIDEKKISVTNTCTRTVDGKSQPEIARAVAHVVPETGNSKLVVNFTGIGLLRWLGIGDGDYWIVCLGPVNSEKQYSWALVGSPSRKYGWILSRKAELPEAEVNKIFQIAEQNGYSRNPFIFTRK